MNCWPASEAISQFRRRKHLLAAGQQALPGLCGLRETALALLVVSGALASTPVEAATLVVTTLANSGPGSLRAALAAASAGDRITFAVSGTITNLTGELVVDKDLTVAGPGPNQLAVSGNNAGRAFNITSGVTVTLSGLTVTSGHAADGVASTNYANPGGPGADGGGIYNAGTLTLSNCLVTQCRSGQGGAGYTDNPPPPLLLGNGPSNGGNGGNGGGIYNAGSLTLTACTLSSNTAGTGGAGGNEVGSVYAGATGGSGGQGGGLYDAGTATLLGCTLLTNSAGAGGGGGFGGSGATSQAGASGGQGGDGGSGGALFSPGSPVLTSCTLVGNTAGPGGAGGTGGPGFSGPQNVPAGAGGTGGTGGTGGSGGGLFTWNTFQWVACTVTGNSAGYGGMGGKGGHGGHTYTLTGDGGSGGNGGAGGNGGGAGTWSSSSTLQNVAVAQDSKGTGGAFGPGGLPGGYCCYGFPGYRGADGAGADLWGTFASNGYNLIGLDEGNTGFTDGTLGDQVGSGTALQALLGPLADHGGPTFTCLPLAGSPMVDAGDDSLLGAPLSLTTDQRGQPRLSGAHVDIGAFERQPPTLPLRLAACSRSTNGAMQLTLTNLPGTSLTVLCATNPALALSNWTVLGWVPETAAGRYQFVDANATNVAKRFYRLRSP